MRAERDASDAPRESAARRSSRRRLAYSIAAGAVTSTAISGSPADAAVIYSGQQDVVVLRGGLQRIRLDYDEYNDVTLRNFVYSGVNNYQGITINRAPGRVVGFSANGKYYISALDEGATIDASTAQASQFYGMLSYGSVRPQAEFTMVEKAYFGFSFPLEDVNNDDSDDVHFAWMRVTIDNMLGKFVINDWAYETQANVAIHAGDLPLKGDYNSNNSVDAADYTIWRNTLGSTTDLRADGDETGESKNKIDMADYLFWKARFGDTAGGGAAAVATPEPMTLGLLAAGSLGLPLLRRRRGRVHR